MASGTRPDLSVIVVNRNTCDLLHACLQSIAVLPDRVSTELILVDNGSTDGSVEMVEDLFPDVHLIRNESNTGFAYPNNQGLAISRGRHVMLLNSDTEVRPHAFERLVRFMDENSRVGACGPTLYYPDGRLQPSCSTFPSPWVHFCDMLLLDRLFPRSRHFGNMLTWFDHRRTAAVDQPAGAALVVRREVLESVGALDERFTIYYNDVDWCFRIHRAGWQICFVHDAEIVHHQGVTTRNENRRMQLTAEMLRNQFDYYRKYFGERGLLWLRVWMGLGFSMRRVLFFLPDLLSSGEGSRWRRRYHLGAIRAAVSGDPNQFLDHENGEGSWIAARGTDLQMDYPVNLTSATPDLEVPQSQMSTRDC